MGKGVSKGVIRWLALAVGTIAQLGLSPAVEAADATGTPTIYKITFTLNFRNKATQVFTTAAVTATDLNIAGVNPNDTVSSVFVNIPVAEYDRAKVTMNCTVKLKGSVTSGGNTFITTSGGGTATGAAANAAEGPYSFPGANCPLPSVTFESPVFNPALQIGGQITIKFDVANSLELNGGVLSPGQFSANMTVP